jgi:hypothetical protein
MRQPPPKRSTHSQRQKRRLEKRGPITEAMAARHQSRSMKWPEAPQV